MGFIADLIMTVFGMIFEQIDMHNGKGIDPKMYGSVPDPWNDYLRSQRRQGK